MKRKYTIEIDPPYYELDKYEVFEAELNLLCKRYGVKMKEVHE